MSTTPDPAAAKQRADQKAAVAEGRLRGEAAATKEQLEHSKDKAAQAASETATGAKRVVEDAKAAAGKAVEDAKAAAAAQARSVTDSVKQKGKAVVEEKKQKVVGEVSGVSAIVRKAAEDARERDDANIAALTEGLADRIDGVANWIDGKQVESVIEDVEAFARRRPEWVLGGLFVGGAHGAR